MKWTLDKLSAPGWPEPKTFATKEDLRLAFWECLCGMCHQELHDKCHDGEDSFYATVEDIWDTPCGLEYHVEEIDDYVE